MHVQQCLTNTIVWNKNMASLDSQSQKVFVREALQQYENESCNNGLRAPQVIVSELPQGMAGRYVFALHAIQVPFIPDLSCTQYLSILKHEDEHGRQQKAGHPGGYQGDAGQMARMSFAVYPAQTHTRNGKYLRPDYAYNYNELRALLEEAKWIHARYQERMNAQPPDCFLQEKQDILSTMQDIQTRIHGRPSVSHALDVNKANARKLLFGKFSPTFVPNMGKLYMSRFMKRTGKQLIKETMRELKEMAKILGKDMKELEKMVSPQYAAETANQERNAVEEYNHQQEYDALLEARVKGFDFISEYPTERAYAITEVDNPRLLNYFMSAFPEQAQSIPEYHGSLHVMESQPGQYRIFVPKELADDPNLDTMKVDRAHMQAKQEELAFDIADLGEIEYGTL